MYNKMSVLNSFFTRNMLRQLLDEKDDKLYCSIVNQYIDKPYSKKNSELISEIYSELVNNYRNEYFYKNTLLNKLLLGVHSVNTTTALTEVPIANSKADFVLINGKAVVYEIKTELDNLDRINTQINDYYKAFDHVAVVTCDKNKDSLVRIVDNICKPVGIYILTKEGRLKTIRKPGKYDKDLDRKIIFDILRQKEYEHIIHKYFGELPQVNQFEYYSSCRKLFLKTPLESLYPIVLKLLKRRTKLEKEQFEEVPYELKFLSYFMRFKRKEYRKLKVFLEKRFGGI